MRKFTLTLLAAVCGACPAAASDATDAAAIAKQYNDDFNKGDLKAAVALCTAQNR